MFLATFLYALIVLRGVRGDDGTTDKFVPGIAVAVSFALVVLSVGFFVQYTQTITTSIRVIEIIDRISRETATAIERVHPQDAQANETAVKWLPPPTRTVHAQTRGVVTSVAVEKLCQVAVRAGVCLVVAPRVGDFVATGMPLVVVHGGGDVDDHEIRRAVALAKERDLAEDPAFGFRQLVDIAERSLSPGINDPTTATQCLDHLHDLLRRLAHRALPPAVAATVRGTVRVVLGQPTWDDYVALAVDEIHHWGADSTQIHRRISSMLDDLAGEVRPGRRAAIVKRRPLLEVPGDDPPAPERRHAIEA